MDDQGQNVYLVWRKQLAVCVCPVPWRFSSELGPVLGSTLCSFVLKGSLHQMACSQSQGKGRRGEGTHSMEITLQDSSERVQQEDGSSSAALILWSCTGVDTVYMLQTVSEVVGSWWSLLCHRADRQAVPLWKLLGNPNPYQEWQWGNGPAESVEMGAASSSWDPAARSTRWNSQGADAISHLWSLAGTLSFSPELKVYLSRPQDLDFFERGLTGAEISATLKLAIANNWGTWWRRDLCLISFPVFPLICSHCSLVLYSTLLYSNLWHGWGSSLFL